jgi:predicted SnoaL-like aldol condensation-catalyzing enzyme
MWNKLFRYGVGQQCSANVSPKGENHVRNQQDRYRRFLQAGTARRRCRECVPHLRRPTYRQHNPLIEDGMDGVRKFVTWIMATHPDARGESKRVFADGDYVILHSHWHGLSNNLGGEAVVDIFRLENGKVVEHWDVIQPIPENGRE